MPRDMETEIAVATDTLRHLNRALSDARMEIATLKATLEEIANSDDIDNALDPERNKRVARAALAKAKQP